MKQKMYENCTILRKMVIRRFTINIVTGMANPNSETLTVVEPCDTPLFSDAERKTGICRSCHDGYSESENEFANEDERIRAMKG